MKRRLVMLMIGLAVGLTACGGSSSPKEEPAAETAPAAEPEEAEEVQEEPEEEKKPETETIQKPAPMEPEKKPAPKKPEKKVTVHEPDEDMPIEAEEAEVAENVEQEEPEVAEGAGPEEKTAETIAPAQIMPYPEPTSYSKAVADAGEKLEEIRQSYEEQNWMRMSEQLLSLGFVVNQLKVMQTMHA